MFSMSNYNKTKININICVVSPGLLAFSPAYYLLHQMRGYVMLVINRIKEDRPLTDPSISDYLIDLSRSLARLKAFSNKDKINRLETLLGFKIASPREELLIEELGNLCTLADYVLIKFDTYKKHYKLKRREYRDDTVKKQYYSGFSFLRYRIDAALLFFGDLLTKEGEK